VDLRHPVAPTYPSFHPHGSRIQIILFRARTAVSIRLGHGRRVQCHGGGGGGGGDGVGDGDLDGTMGKNCSGGDDGGPYFGPYNDGVSGGGKPY